MVGPRFPQTVVITVTIPHPYLEAGSTITAEAVEGVAYLPGPFVIEGGGVLVQPSVVVGQAYLPLPTVTITPGTILTSPRRSRGLRTPIESDGLLSDTDPDLWSATEAGGLRSRKSGSNDGSLRSPKPN